MVLGASLLFDNTYFGFSFASDVAFLGFHPLLPIFTYFHSPPTFLADFSPLWQPSMCGLSASPFVDLHPVSNAIVKVNINMQMTSVQMKINQ